MLSQWGCHSDGSTSHLLRRTFSMMVKNYNPSMVVLLEPRINGLKADAFIKKKWVQQFSSAEGFSGGIWILWRDIFDVEIVRNHTQFIHLRVSYNNQLVSWITAIYGSPITSIRKSL